MIFFLPLVCTSSHIKLVQRISAEPMTVPAWRVDTDERKFTQSGCGGWRGGGKTGIGAFFCVSGLTLIMATLISVSQRRLAWKDAT